jgi:hypothetical protein
MQNSKCKIQNAKCKRGMPQCGCVKVAAAFTSDVTTYVLFAF